MATKKIPGVYMIRNKLNGKVYIGQSSDIPKRFKQYRWAANSDKVYSDVRRSITQAIVTDGIEHFDFVPLVYGPDYADSYARLLAEHSLILEYRANEKRYGYNETIGWEPGLSAPRKQKTVERLKRAKDLFLYDTETNSSMLFFGGAKAIGDYLGFSKDVMSHNVKRGSLILNKYYVIPANQDERDKLIDKLRHKKTENTHQAKRAQSHSKNAFDKYMEAIHQVEKDAERLEIK